jgi:signal transduction histidine kinase
MVVVDDASKDHRTGQPQVGAGDVGPALWAPLVAGGRPFGTLSVARSKGGAAFRPPEIEVVRSFAAQASVILEVDQARQTLERLAELEKRERIARDLHDTVIQRLFATGMSLQASLGVVTDPVVKDRLARSVDELDVTIRQIRTVIFGLEDPHPGGAPALRSRTVQLARETARLLGFEPEIAFNGAVDTIVPEPITTELLATLREALTNVARHSLAQHVRIDVAIEDDDVHLQVADDGVGLDRSTLDSSAGHGLANMRARAERLGGRCEVGGRGDGGTLLSWRVPLSDGPGRPG